MFKRITATALAASLALTSLSAAPARAADSGEIARTILGAGVLLYLGNELSKNNRHGTYTNRRNINREYRPRVHRKVVPAACLRNNQYRSGPRRYFGRHCLSKNMRNYHRLPSGCQTSVRTHRGWRTVYAAPCLRRSGWRFG